MTSLLREIPEVASLDAPTSLIRIPPEIDVPLTDRVRVMGAQALTYCQMAAGRTDAVVCLKPSRSVDFAAAQLVVREAGYAIELIDDPPLAAAPLDLKARSRIVAAANADVCGAIARALGPL